jgi:hypothetical protein
MRRSLAGLALVAVASSRGHAQGMSSTPSLPQKAAVDSLVKQLARRAATPTLSALAPGRYVSPVDGMPILVPDTSRCHMPTVRPDASRYHMPVLAPPGAVPQRR